MHFLFLSFLLSLVPFFSSFPLSLLVSECVQSFPWLAVFLKIVLIQGNVVTGSSRDRVFRLLEHSVKDPNQKSFGKDSDYPGLDYMLSTRLILASGRLLAQPLACYLAGPLESHSGEERQLPKESGGHY